MAILTMYSQLFVAIIAEFDRIRIDERLPGAMNLPKFIEDYLFSNTQ